VHVASVVWVGYGYWAFRKSGGIFGDSKNSKTERLLSGAGTLVKAGAKGAANLAENQLDKNSKREINAD